MKSKFIIILIGRVIQVLISFLTIKIVTNYLSPTNVAYYFLILSIMNYFGLTLISPIGQYVNRQLHSWQHSNVLFDRLLNHFLYISVVSILSYFLIFIGSHYFSLLSGLDSQKVAILVSVAVFSNTLITTIVPIFNMLDYQKTFVIYTVCWLLISLILSVAIISIMGDNIYNWFLGQIFAQLLFSCGAIITLKRFIKQKISFQSIRNSISKVAIKEVLIFSLPLVLSTFFLWGTTDSFRFVLEKTYGLEYLGLFSVGFAISQRFSYAIESIAQQVFYPQYYKEIASPNKAQRVEAWHTLFYSSFPLYILTLIGTIVTAPLLIKIFAGPAYYHATIFIIYGALFNFFRKIAALYALIAHSEKDTKKLILPYFIGTLFSTIGIYLGQGHDHLPGIILSLGSLAMLMAMSFSTRHHFSLKWENKMAFDTIKKLISLRSNK